MMRDRVARLCVLLVVTGGSQLAALPARAQETSARSSPAEDTTAMPGRGARGARPAGPMTAPQVEQYFDQVVLNQARVRLKLSDSQFFRFGGALRRLQTVRRQQQRQRLALLRDLNDAVEGSRPDAEIVARLADLDGFNEASSRQLNEARAALDDVLDLRQRARFRVFEAAMERRKLDLLARARRVAAEESPGAAPGRVP